MQVMRTATLEELRKMKDRGETKDPIEDNEGKYNCLTARELAAYLMTMPDAEIRISLYGCGTIVKEPFTFNRIRFKKRRNIIEIDAEDN